MSLNSLSLPPLATPATRLKRTPFLPLVIAFIAVGSLISGMNILIMGFTLPVATFLAATLALIPLSVLYYFYLNLDSGEPETKKMLILSFLWGALGATGFAIISNTFASATLGTFFGVVIAAPIGEEILKGAFIFLLFWWKRNHFDGILDGLVYAGFLGMGFAFVENITYFAAAYSGLSVIGEQEITGGLGSLLATFLVRSLSLFAHPLFTSAVGIGIGVAVMSKTKRIRVLAPILGLLTSIALHALWNFSAYSGSGVVVSIVYSLFIVLFFAFVIFALRHRSHALVQLQKSLLDLARLGALAPSETVWMVDLAHRRAAYSFARRYGSLQTAACMKKYQENTLRLAFIHVKVMHGVADAESLEMGKHYFSEMQRYRPHISFPPPPGAVAGQGYYTLAPTAPPAIEIESSEVEESQGKHRADAVKLNFPTRPPVPEIVSEHPDLNDPRVF